MAETNADKNEALGRITATATLFPFVCGICYEKFNKIDVFYLHLQAHNQNTSDCFHICNDKQSGKSCVSKTVKNIFTCGSCSKTFFSICTLHKHMQDIYDQGSYEFDHSINTAFPKGSPGNICLTTDIQNEVNFLKTTLENNVNNNEESGVGLESTNSHDIKKKRFSKANKMTTKIKKKTHQNDKGHSNNMLEKQKSDYSIVRENNFNNISNDQNSLEQAGKNVKRRRGRPPKEVKSNTSEVKENHSIASKDYTVGSEPKSEAAELHSFNTEQMDTKQGKVSNAEDGFEPKVKNHKKRRKEAETSNSNIENVKSGYFSVSLDNGNVHIDTKSDDGQKFDQTTSDAAVTPVKDTNVCTEIGNLKISDTANSVETNVKMEHVKSKAKHKPIDASKMSNVEKDSIKIKRKRKKHTGDETVDGINLLENKKAKKYFYTCGICNKTMGLSHKRRHNAIHAAAMEGIPKPQEFETCDICGKSVVRAGLKYHQTLHSDERPYLCDRCPKAFKLKSNLHHHKQIHEDFKPHECETCGKRFHRRTDLRFHMRVHTDERPVQCPQCPLRFRKTSTLNIHMKVHRGDKCHQCELCGKAFIRKDYLKRHMVWHNGQASHECEICNKKFMEKGGLQRHVKIHSDERAHVCHLCGKAFAVSSNLKQHVKKLHSSDREQKRAALNAATEEDDNIVDTGNQTDMSIPNIPEVQQYKETPPEERKTEIKAEYHTLMPRMREFETSVVLPSVGQSRTYAIPQEFGPAQPPFYSSAPVGIVQLPYPDATMISHLSLPVRQTSEMNSDVTRHVYNEQQQAIQTISMQYTIADNNLQHYTDI